MDSNYAPRSPDLSGYAPQSPDLTSYRPQSPSLGPQQHNYAPQSPHLSALQNYQLNQDQQIPAYPHNPHQQQQPLHHLPQQWMQQQHELPQQPTYPTSQPSAQQQSYPQYTSQPPQHQALNQQQFQDHFAYQLQQTHQRPAYGSFSDSTTAAMPAQTRTSNRTQQISYADIPEPKEDYDYTCAQPAPMVSSDPLEPVQQPQQQLPQQPQMPQQPLPQYIQPAQPAPAATPARRGRKPKSETHGVNAQPVLKKMDTGGVEVKTKFPTARIKRIMQADEDVGKVAQVTPVVVAKALELFMIRLITSSANAAKARGSKKVMSQHMKLAVMQDDQFDNLRDIMAKVPDAPTKSSNGNSGAKDEDADEDMEDKPAPSAAKAKGKGRGKKRRDSDDF